MFTHELNVKRNVNFFSHLSSKYYQESTNPTKRLSALKRINHKRQRWAHLKVLNQLNNVNQEFIESPVRDQEEKDEK